MVCYLHDRLRPARYHPGHLDDATAFDARVGGGAIALPYLSASIQ
jgi:hypothetical protein